MNYGVICSTRYLIQIHDHANGGLGKTLYALTVSRILETFLSLAHECLTIETSQMVKTKPTVFVGSGLWPGCQTLNQRFTLPRSIRQSRLCPVRSWAKFPGHPSATSSTSRGRHLQRSYCTRPKATRAWKFKQVESSDENC